MASYFAGFSPWPSFLWYILFLWLKMNFIVLPTRNVYGGSGIGFNVFCTKHSIFRWIFYSLFMRLFRFEFPWFRFPPTMCSQLVTRYWYFFLCNYSRSCGSESRGSLSANYERAWTPLLLIDLFHLIDGSYKSDFVPGQLSIEAW